MTEYRAVQTCHELPRFAIAALSTLVFASGQPGTAWAQESKREVPDEQVVTLQTKDGVTLHTVFFPGTEGKKSVPVIMVHGWEGQGSDFRVLAGGLQRYFGHAVIVPDLRGHGNSTMRKVPGRAATEKIERDRMRTGDIQDMYRFDLEAVKKYLMEKHNAGELNIELLCVIGAEMGAAVAMNWVAQDWSWPRLPTIKQGQDVKAFILISPPVVFKGVRLLPALRQSHPAVRSELSAMIVYGTQASKDARFATQLHRTLEGFHTSQAEDLLMFDVDSDQQGTKLLSAPVNNGIARFIDARLVKRQDLFLWAPRQNPLGS